MKNKISLDQDNYQLVLKCAFEIDRVYFLKTLPGHRWNPEKKEWTFPYHPTVLNIIKNAIVPLEVSPELNGDITTRLEPSKKSLLLRESLKIDKDKLTNLEEQFRSLFDQVNIIEQQIFKKLNDISGKKQKGNQFVGLYGEALVAALLGGEIVKGENVEPDVIVNDKRFSVKTRKGNESGWEQTSLIATNDANAVDFLVFVHLRDDYSVDCIWSFPWQRILSEGRIKGKSVRGKERGYFFKVSPAKDREYLIYPS